MIHCRIVVNDPFRSPQLHLGNSKCHRFNYPSTIIEQFSNAFKMKFVFAVLVSFIASTTVSALNLPKHNLLSRALVTKLRRTVRQKSCNLNLCFAIDGSSSITADNFESVKNFVEIITVLVDPDSGAKYAATQFGDSSETISPLINDFDAFTQALRNANPNGDSSSAIGAGILFCDEQLEGSLGNANKIVVITDGLNTAGMDPVIRANNFRLRDPNGDLCTVGIGSSDNSQLLAIAGGDPRKVLTVSDYVDLVESLEALMSRVCG